MNENKYMAQIKAFQIRLPREMWIFLKHKSMDKNTSMNGLIMKYIEKDMKRIKEKSLKGGDTVVS